MIYDRLANREVYHFSPAVRKALDFLQTLSSSSEEGTYPIDGDNVFAMVQAYETTSAPVELLEGHRKYADIQYTICGEEMIAVTSLDGLTESVPFNADKDVAFYKAPARTAEMPMPAGTFLILLPQDAHYGRFALETPMAIKKVVIKIRRDLL